jgi:hypothetical protein
MACSPPRCLARSRRPSDTLIAETAIFAVFAMTSICWRLRRMVFRPHQISGWRYAFAYFAVILGWPPYAAFALMIALRRPRRSSACSCAHGRRVLHHGDAVNIMMFHAWAFRNPTSGANAWAAFRAWICRRSV